MKFEYTLGTKQEPVKRVSSLAAAKAGVCSVCYEKGLTELHHIVPISLGGPDSVNNMVELCLTCHGKVHGLPTYESRRMSQAAGIAKARVEGKYKGRAPTARAKADEVMELYLAGVGATKIADQVGIGRASVYRILEDKGVKNEDRRHGH